MKRVYDPTGIELVRGVLEITAKDEQGRPTDCRVRYDDETIDLTSKPGPNMERREFLIVWTANRDRLGSGPIPEEAELADMLRESVALLKQARAENKTSRDLIARIEVEVRDKTEALRRLQDERDPAIVERKVADAVARATDGLEEDVKNYRGRLAAAEREIEELRASKRKLREALERAKDGGRRR